MEILIFMRELPKFHIKKVGATAVSPPPFFMIDYDREFHADSEKYKNIALKINGKCSNSTSKF